MGAKFLSEVVEIFENEILVIKQVDFITANDTSIE